MAKKSKSKLKIILISIVVLVALLISYSVFFKKERITRLHLLDNKLCGGH